MKHVAPDHVWVQGPWFEFEPRTGTCTTLKVSFQRGSKHAAFLCIAHARFRTRIFEVRPTYAVKPWKLPEMGQKR